MPQFQHQHHHTRLTVCTGLAACTAEVAVVPRCACESCPAETWYGANDGVVSVDIELGVRRGRRGAARRRKNNKQRKEKQGTGSAAKAGGCKKDGSYEQLCHRYCNCGMLCLSVCLPPPPSLTPRYVWMYVCACICLSPSSWHVHAHTTLGSQAIELRGSLTRNTACTFVE